MDGEQRLFRQALTRFSNRKAATIPSSKGVYEEPMEKSRVPDLWKMGDFILHRYEVTDLLGEGGMGTVYKIYDQLWKIDLAAKSPKPAIFVRSGGKENFLREAATWVSLEKHPHIVSCHAVRTLGVIPRVFAEYVDGRSLADWIRERTLYKGGNEAALTFILDIAIQFAWGLHYAHEQGLVHQDVKPANVMITKNGIAKVTDFGLAKARAAAGEETLPKPVGDQGLLVSWGGMTSAYCSPEQAASQPLSHKTDIWSWAVSVLQMFVGRVSWQSGPQASEALARYEHSNTELPAIPLEVIRLLGRCLQHRPQSRPATMQEVADELRVLYKGLVGHPYPRAIPAPVPKDAGALLDQALSLSDLQRGEEALVVIEQAIKLEPTSTYAYYMQGVVLQELGRLGEALAAFDQAIELDQTSARAYLNKGTVLYDLKNLPGSGRLQSIQLLNRAREAYEQVIRLDPTYAPGYLHQATVGKYEQALAASERACQLDPTDVRAPFNKAIALSILRRYEQALAAYEQAIALDQSYGLAYTNKGILLHELGRREEALAAFEQALQIAPSAYFRHDRAYYRKGLILHELGKQEEALTAFERAIEINPAYAKRIRQRQPDAVRARIVSQTRTPADSTPAIWKVGDLILSRYEVTSKLGEGGMGAVYKLHDRQLNFDQAVKSPRPEIFTTADGKENFIREAETWMKLRAHPHLVKCFHVQTLGGIPRIFAEYVDGGSLADWIRLRKLYEGGEALALERILDVAIQFAWGLHAAHEQGLVHQDIKPANVMLTSQGIAKVTDFGLAKARVMAGEGMLPGQEGKQSHLVSWGGMTPAYCSPEQAAKQMLSSKTDIWSWGLSVLQMFAGKVTWTVGVSARQALASHVRKDMAIPLMPPEVVKLLNRCFEPQPEKRPASMLEVANELQAIYVHAMGRAYPRENPQPQLTQKDASRLSDQGLALYELGKPEEALVVYEQAIRLDPAFVLAHHNKGLALKQLGRLEEALAAFEHAVRLCEADTYKGKGLSLNIDSPLADAYNEKGLVLKQLGRLEEALAAFEHAIDFDPVFAFAYNNKGNVLRQLEQPQQALVAFEQAIRCDPTYAIAHYSKGMALLLLGRRSSALEAFQQATHLDHTLATAIEKLLHSYEQAIANPRPILPTTYESLGLALLQQGKLEEALAAYELAIRHSPTLAIARYGKGLVLSQLGKLEEALAAYEQAIRLDPTFAIAHFNKGLVLKQLGRREESLAAYEQAIHLDPTFAQYWRMML